jgi:hypothetical protein
VNTTLRNWLAAVFTLPRAAAAPPAEEASPELKERLRKLLQNSPYSSAPYKHLKAGAILSYVSQEDADALARLIADSTITEDGKMLRVREDHEIQEEITRMERSNSFNLFKS